MNIGGVDINMAYPADYLYLLLAAMLIIFVIGLAAMALVEGTKEIVRSGKRWAERRAGAGSELVSAGPGD